MRCTRICFCFVVVISIGANTQRTQTILRNGCCTAGLFVDLQLHSTHTHMHACISSQNEKKHESRLSSVKKDFI